MSTHTGVLMVELISNTRPDEDKLLTSDAELGLVRAWSYSALKVFEECPYRTYISRVKKIAEPSSPAADRGSAIHQQAEDYVKGELEGFPDTLAKFKPEFIALHDLYAEGKVELEGEWAYTIDWQPTKWLAPDCWARIKLDAFVRDGETSARVIDYKTGKKFGNEIGHGQQCLLYAIGAFVRVPELEYVQTELWYLDKGETTTKSFTRAQALHFMPGFHQRALTMTTCTDFEPKPGKETCRWCSYRKGEYPECRWGVGD